MKTTNPSRMSKQILLYCSDCGLTNLHVFSNKIHIHLVLRDRPPYTQHDAPNIAIQYDFMYDTNVCQFYLFVLYLKRKSKKLHMRFFLIKYSFSPSTAANSESVEIPVLALTCRLLLRPIIFGSFSRFNQPDG